MHQQHQRPRPGPAEGLIEQGHQLISTTHGDLHRRALVRWQCHRAQGIPQGLQITVQPGPARPERREPQGRWQS
jgi:hypothetical protein